MALQNRDQGSSESSLIKKFFSTPKPDYGKLFDHG